MARNTKIKLPTPQEVQEFKNRKRILPVQSQSDDDEVQIVTDDEQEMQEKEIASTEPESIPELDSLLRNVMVNNNVSSKMNEAQSTMLADGVR
ncbi:hypothetical protein Ga0451573_003913, partial [Peptococcaceae bacterium DYL19]|nr:hypothetical protein [Phosphitispora fastidiosa]